MRVGQRSGQSIGGAAADGGSILPLVIGEGARRFSARLQELLGR